MSGFEKIEFEGNAVNVSYDHNLTKMALDLLQKLWFKISKAGFLYAKHEDKVRDLSKATNMHTFVSVHILCTDPLHR